MATSNTPKTTGTTGRKLKGMATAAALLAAEQLIQRLLDRDEREKMVAEIQRRRAQWKRWRAEDSWWLGTRIGQHRLDRRAAALEASLASLTTDRPELAEALAAIAAELVEVRSALTVAAGLPSDRRKQVHRSTDDTLDRLDETVLHLVAPTSA